jgi:hypothetical protein
MITVMQDHVDNHFLEQELVRSPHDSRLGNLVDFQQSALYLERTDKVAGSI